MRAIAKAKKNGPMGRFYLVFYGTSNLGFSSSTKSEK